ncbi:hypothetical protein HMPREF0497_1377, partial [Lentilactobacillus buchneri ATCC 11577]
RDLGRAHQRLDFGDREAREARREGGIGRRPGRGFHRSHRVERPGGIAPDLPPFPQEAGMGRTNKGIEPLHQARRQ